jgi:hypothetical protein
VRRKRQAKRIQDQKIVKPEGSEESEIVRLRSEKVG